MANVLLVNLTITLVRERANLAFAVEQDKIEYPIF